jgi:hypothetical protein
MYDPDTIEFAQELGVDPGDLSSSDPYADDSGVAFQQQNQYRASYQFQYDDLQDDIGDYMHLFVLEIYLSEARDQSILLRPPQSVV